MPDSRPTSLIACKPILAGSAKLMSGYRTFHEQEAKYTAIALEEMPDAVATWYRYLTLYDQTLRREHESPSPEVDDRRRAWKLRLQLSSAAAGTAKLVLDAGLAGYYSQAFALVRHMLETWQQMVYVRLNPQAAIQWYTSEDGSPPREPATKTIINKLKQLAKDANEMETLRNALVVEREVTELRKGAHPSGLAAAQTLTGKDGFLQLGANFDRGLLSQVLSKGTLAMALLLHELARTVPVDDAWRTEFGAIAEARMLWLEMEM